MHVFIVYAHPSDNSFTRQAKDEFIKGLIEKGHTYEISDLYKMGFKTDLSQDEYIREAFYRDDLPIEDDVLLEHKKINACDAIVFIYPVFWSEAPAKLVGWFDRVWTQGFAYGGNRKMKKLDKALFICSAGTTADKLAESGLLESMKNIMLKDRIADRAKHSEMIVFGGTSRHNMKLRQKLSQKHLDAAYRLGLRL